VEWARTSDSKCDCASLPQGPWGATGTGIVALLMIRETWPGMIGRHPILHVGDAQIDWRRIYEMDI